MEKLVYRFLLCVAIISHSAFLFPQSTQYQPDKPGKFVLNNQQEKCPGVDVTTFKNNLTAIVEWVRLNDSVLGHPTGFDAVVGLSAYCFDERSKMKDYGIRGSIGISFHHFYTENGVSHTATGWSAHGTEIIINNPMYYISTQFDEAEFKTDDPPHLKQPLEKARENLRKYYTTAPVIKEIAPGVRLYASDAGTWFKGSLLIFNPERPEIWIPVTVKEIMETKMAYYKVKHEIDSINYEKMVAGWAKMNFNPDPDHTMRPRLYNVIKQEYENFTAEELKLPAFASAGEESGISGINSRGEGRAVVKFNPDCWDRSLPLTTVQYMSWDYRPETELELEKFKPRNGGLTDFVGLFFNSLPVEKLGVLIEKK
jgi:hypothetical protein